MFRKVHVLQKSVQHSVATQDSFPGVRANQVTDPQWNNYQLIEKIFSLTCVEREIVGQRIAQQQGKDHDSGCNPHGSKKSLQVNIHAEEFAIVVQCPGVDDGL